MIKNLKYDCGYFNPSKPCEPHKKFGVICNNCDYYKKSSYKILIIKFAAQGDVLRTTSILPALKEKHAESKIYWITEPDNFPLLKNNSYVDCVLTNYNEYLPLLNTVKFDEVINPDSDIKSAALAAIAKANIKRGYYLTESGFVEPIDKESENWFLMGINDTLKRNNKKTYFEIIYEIAGLKGINIYKPQIFPDDNEKIVAAKFYEENNLGKYKKVIGVNTGSGERWKLKKWGLESYISLIKKLKNTNPELAILLFGGKSENNFNKGIVESNGDIVIDTGTNNNLREFFSLINLCDVFFSPDSLGFHASLALGKTTIVYTGPTSYTELDVFGKGEIIHSDIDCLCCYLNRCDKEVNCMNTLSVNYVHDKITKSL